MIDLHTRFLTAVAAIAIILTMMTTSAFAGSTIHIQASANEANSNAPEPAKWFFENENFNLFFTNFFAKKLRADMNGAQEVPGPGDPDGTGEGKVRIKLNESELCVDLEVENIDTATAAHIHHAPAGSSGAVVVSLPIPDEEGEADGCVSVDNNLLNAIKNNPQDYYVNVHNNSYPNGAIRGQLSK